MSAESAAVRPQKFDGSAVGATLRRPWLILFSCITLPVIALDQASKLFVKAHMELYESISVVSNYFDITYTLNPGAAFSMLADAPPWVRKVSLITLACVAIVVLFVLVVRAQRVSLNSVALALILGGASGNLIDRAIRGRVIDFVRWHYYDANFPVFNVADSAITVGVTLIILATLLGIEDDPPVRSN